MAFAASFARVGAVLLLLSASAACGGGDAGPKQRSTRFLDERRALEIIRRTLEQQGLKPAAPREVDLAGKSVRVDVGVEGKEYGIIYLTQEDAEKAGEAILPAPSGDDAPLRLVSGDGEAKFVVLYQSVYGYDDHMGESHQETTIASEGKLARDVKDFLIRASSKGYK